VITWSLFSDMPLAYVALASCFIALILKITCVRSMSLLMSLVTIVSSFEALSLYYLCYTCIFFDTSDVEVTLEKKWSIILKYYPALTVLCNICFNFYVTLNHLNSVKVDVNSIQGAESKKL